MTDFIAGTQAGSTGGGGTPGGSDTQVQFNDSGSFGGDAGLTFVKGTDTLNVGSIINVLPGSGSPDAVFGGDLALNAGAATNARLTITSPQNANIIMGETSEPTDQKFIQWLLTNALILRGVSDDGNSVSEWMHFSRGGINLTLVIISSPIQPTGYKSADGTDGITQDVTTGTLVGKTMTFKDGILVGFA